MLFLALCTRSPVRNLRNPEPGVVGTSFWLLPRVGVRGGGSGAGRSVSETETSGADGGAASEGRTGVDVCLFKGGVR
jgi:hypothetical protein